MTNETLESAVTNIQDVTEGTWLVAPLGRGYNRRPHLFFGDEERAVCGRTKRPYRSLRFDPETWMSIDKDPRLGTEQYRRPCGLCKPIWDYAHGAAPRAEGDLLAGYVPEDTDDVLDVLRATARVGFVVTRVVGTDKNACAHFDVDTSMSSEGADVSDLLYMFTRTADRIALRPAPRPVGSHA